MKGQIEDHVFEGIRKTINRFREKPFHYFTEADIHSSLLNDMISGSSGTLSKRHENLEISLVHQEYPTNFRYEKEKLLKGYGKSIKMTRLGYKDAVNKTYGDRGNYDLTVLNPDFVKRMIEKKHGQEAMDQIINKDLGRTQARMDENEKLFNQEVLYAIEVKFLHSFNARNKNMLEEIVKDNEKLRLAYLHSDMNLKPINLVFCSASEGKKRKDKKDSIIQKIKDYITNGSVDDYSGNSYTLPIEILIIFIEVFLAEDDSKMTIRPIASKTPLSNWAQKLRNVL